AVERVDVPAILAGRFMRRAFLRHDLVLGPAGAQARHDQLFGGAVGDGDHVGLALVFHRHPAAEVLHEQRARLAGDIGGGSGELVGGHWWWSLGKNKTEIPRLRAPSPAAAGSVALCPGMTNYKGGAIAGLKACSTQG